MNVRAVVQPGNRIVITVIEEGKIVIPAALGVRGPTGIQGPVGSEIYVDEGAPDDLNGLDNDIYIDSLTGDVYKKAAGEWGIPQGNIRGPTGESGNPDIPGGDEGEVLTKDNDLDNEYSWFQYAYDGFSARFNAEFSSTDLNDTLTKIINIQYTAPLVSLSASGNVLREKGDEVTASTLTAAVTKRSDPIAEVRFYLNPSTLLDTQTVGGAIPDGGNSTYSWTGSFSDNTTFRASVDDDGATGGPTTVNATTTFNFVYPYYVGAGAAALSAANVATLTKRIINSTASRVETITAGAGQVFYFAYPASYGALTSILDGSDFETFADWTLRTENITGLDGSPVSYRIYEFNNPVTAGDYTYRFIR